MNEVVRLAFLDTTSINTMTEGGADSRAAERFPRNESSFPEGATFQKFEIVLCYEAAHECCYFCCEHCNNMLEQDYFSGFGFSLYDGSVFPTVRMAIP